MFEKSKNKYLILLIFLILSLGLKAQITTRYNLFTNNLFLYNPAYAGHHDQLAASLHYRNHLVGISNSPTTATFAIDMPIFRKTSIGLTAKSDKRGLLDNNSLNLAYSYRTKISDKQKISLGILGGFEQMKLNSGGAVVFDELDPTLQSTSYNKTGLFTGAGLTYNYQNFEFNAAMPFLMLTNKEKVAQFMSFTSYKFLLPNDDFTIRPAVGVLVQDNNLDYASVHLMALWKEFVWIETAYKTNNSLVFSIGTNMKKFGISYAYDTNTKNLSGIGGATHEITLSYGINKIKPEIPDTLFADTTTNEELIRVVDANTYEQYVKANNYAFFSDVLDLVDEVYNEQEETSENTSVSDSLKIAENLRIQDSIKIAENLRIQDSIIIADSLKRISFITDSLKQDKQRKIQIRNKLFAKNVNYEMGSSYISDKNKIFLDSIIQVMKKDKTFSIIIQGHTCNIGTDDANKEISQKRVVAVETYLISNGISLSRIKTESYAATKPIAPNNNETNRKKNRRVNFIIIEEK